MKINPRSVKILICFDESSNLSLLEAKALTHSLKQMKTKNFDLYVLYYPHSTVNELLSVQLNNYQVTFIHLPFVSPPKLKSLFHKTRMVYSRTEIMRMDFDYEISNSPLRYAEKGVILSNNLRVEVTNNGTKTSLLTEFDPISKRRIRRPLSKLPIRKTRRDTSLARKTPKCHSYIPKHSKARRNISETLWL